MKQIKLLLFWLALAAATWAADPFIYTAGGTATATSLKLTMQLPSTATAKARPLGVFISCPAAACDVVFTRGGTAATSTAVTRFVLGTTYPPTPGTSQLLVFSASNSTGGTALPTISLPAGWANTLDASNIRLAFGDVLSVTVTGASSQVIQIVPQWEEY